MADADAAAVASRWGLRSKEDKTMTDVSIEQGPTPHGAVRLIMEARGRRVRMLSRDHLDMIVATGETVTDESSPDGFWMEVRDSQNRTRHRQAIQDFADRTIEVFSGGPGDTIRRVDAGRRSRVVSVLVPDFGADHHLAVVRRAPGARGSFAHAVQDTELARFSLARDDDEAGAS
jgi:hypothetical protein